MAKIFEVRFKDGGVIVAHQFASEYYAKIDAKQISKSHARSLLGEMDYEANNLFRVCEFVGGVQGKWENRSDAVIPCKILLTLQDTAEMEQTTPSLQPVVVISEEEKQAKKAALAAIRAEAERKSQKPEREKAPKAESNKVERRDLLISQGIEGPLADLICASNVHSDSPNFKALTLLWKGKVVEADFPGMKPKELNVLMNKLRALLISNETGKAISTSGGSAGMSYRLIDYKLEIIEEEVA